MFASVAISGKMPRRLAVLGDVAEAARDRLGRRVGTAPAGRRPRPRPWRPARRRAPARRTSAPRRRGPASPTISPCAHRERHVAERGGATEPRTSSTVSPGAGGPRRELLRHVATHHPANQLRATQALRAHRRDVPAVAQHRHAIGEREDLFEPVRHVDDAEPALAQPPQHREERSTSGAGQGRRRLVEDQHARVDSRGRARSRPSAAARRSGRDRRRGADADAELVEQLLDRAVHLAAPQERAAALAAEPHVLGRPSAPARA